MGTTKLFKNLFKKECKPSIPPEEIAMTALTPNGTITVVRTDVCNFYDSEWQVTINGKDRVIIRHDSETMDRFLPLVLEAVRNGQDVYEALDIRDRIYYD